MCCLFFQWLIFCHSCISVFYRDCLLKWLQEMTKEIIGIYQTILSSCQYSFSLYKISVAIQQPEQWFGSHTMFLKNLNFIHKLMQARRAVNDINFITACHTRYNSMAHQRAGIFTTQHRCTILHFLRCFVSYFSKSFKLASKGFW